MKLKSLRTTLMVVFSLILVLVVIANILINSLLLPKVYRNKKIDAMETFYFDIYKQYGSGADNDAIIATVKSVLLNENIRVFVWNENNDLVIDSLPLSKEDEDGEVVREFSDEQENGANKNNKRYFGKKNFSKYFGNGRMELFLYYSDIKQESVILENSNYMIFSFSTEAHGAGDESYYFYLRGSLPNNYKILLQMPFASIDEAVGISNTFLFFTGMIMLFIGIIVVAITSKNIAKPVKELSDIASSMEKLDFSRQYVHNRRDEIGSLGDSINSLSSKLESTISQLSEKNQKLEEDIELKLRIDSMRKEFIANASHELKTPLALISGYAEGLRDNVARDDDSRKLYADVIIEETQRMDSIIRQMLDLMEIDSLEAIVDGVEFSLSAMVDEVINSLNLKFNSENIELSVKLQGDTVVYGEYPRIYQTVLNFVSNAINHVDDKKKIDISVFEKGDSVWVTVYNSGANIPEDDMDKIWERFYKVDKAHTREYGGTGLGLAIARSVIQHHKGEYGVKNLSDGVEFYFSIKKEKNDEN